MCLHTYIILKALFNNVFTLKQIWAACPYMLSVSLIRCKNEELKKIAPQKHNEVLERSENRQVTGFVLLISHFSPYTAVLE